jgi:uncharacterized protein YciI
MIFCHASITTVDGYVTKREPHRRAHLERLMALRSGGVVVGGGPSPDGTTADIFYRGPSEAGVLHLVQEDPYYVGGVWASHRLAAFSHFLEPWELAPLVTDGSRVVTIVEGWLSDVDMAALALVEARGAGRLAFGGFFPDGRSLTVMRSADPAEAVSWLAETGFWKEESLAPRPLLHVL